MLAVLATRVVNGRVCPRILLSLFIAFILPGGLLLLLPNTYYYCIVVPAVCLDCTTGVRPIVNRCADTSKVFQVGAILQPTRPRSSFNPFEQKKIFPLLPRSFARSPVVSFMQTTHVKRLGIFIRGSMYNTSVSSMSRIIRQSAPFYFMLHRISSCTRVDPC